MYPDSVLQAQGYKGKGSLKGAHGGRGDQRGCAPSGAPAAALRVGSGQGAQSFGGRGCGGDRRGSPSGDLQTTMPTAVPYQSHLPEHRPREATPWVTVVRGKGQGAKGKGEGAKGKGEKQDQGRRNSQIGNHTVLHGMGNFWQPLNKANAKEYDAGQTSFHTKVTSTVNKESPRKTFEKGQRRNLAPGEVNESQSAPRGECWWKVDGN